MGHMDADRTSPPRETRLVASDSWAEPGVPALKQAAYQQHENAATPLRPAFAPLANTVAPALLLTVSSKTVTFSTESPAGARPKTMRPALSWSPT